MGLDRADTWVTQLDERQGVVRVRRYRLTVTEGPDLGKTAVFESNAVRVGAGEASAFVVKDPKISRVHFQIQPEDQGFRLRDLGSRNGTFLSGVRVNDVQLTGPASLLVGGSLIQFEPLDEFTELPLSKSQRFGALVGRSVAMRRLFYQLERIAQSDAPVLIEGETGTGKELVAEALHEASPRSKGPLVVMDCSSLSTQLAESELFGHEAGAFTGAQIARAGVFERAQGGTLFLDEVGELPLDLQPKVLRALGSQRIRRVGGSEDIAVDARILAATNRDLAAEVNRGRFREDLCHRLAVLMVRIPPLRERLEDIPLLAESLLQQNRAAAGTTLQPQTLRRLMGLDWPGNVRELRNVLERALVMEDAGVPQQDVADDSPLPLIDLNVQFKPAKQQLMDRFEKEYVRALLEKHDGNISAAARTAGVDRMWIHKLAQRFGLDVQQFRKG